MRAGAVAGLAAIIRMPALGTMLAVAVAVAADTAPAQVTPFSASVPGGALPAGWRATRIPRVPRETRYALVEEGSRVVLRAESAGGMSGLTHPLRADPAATPVLRWRWKVSGPLEAGRFGSREADDYAARVYVLFDYDLGKLPLGTRLKVRFARALYGEAVPAAGLCYVWDARAPVGTSAWSAYTDRLRMVVASSGAERAGQWVEVRRDVAEDFRIAFGEAPPAIIGVAVATDTDNTSGSVTAWYGDLELLAR